MIELLIIKAVCSGSSKFALELILFVYISLYEQYTQLMQFFHIHTFHYKHKCKHTITVCVNVRLSYCIMLTLFQSNQVTVKVKHSEVWLCFFFELYCYFS